MICIFVNIITLFIIMMTDASAANSQEQQLFRLESFHGEQIIPLLPLLNQWSIQAFQKPPYLYAGYTQDQEDPNHRIFAKDPEGLVVVARKLDGTVIGISACTTFTWPDLQAFFERNHEGMYSQIIALGYDLNEIFYISCILTADEYSYEPTLSVAMFDTIHNWARIIGKRQLCWWEDCGFNQNNQYEQIETWKEHVDGFKKMGLRFRSVWPTYQPDGSIKDEEHFMEFFIKPIVG